MFFFNICGQQKKKGNFKKSVFDFYETLTEKYL